MGEDLLKEKILNEDQQATLMEFFDIVPLNELLW